MPGSALLFVSQLKSVWEHLILTWFPKILRPVRLSIVSQQGAVVAVWLSFQSSWSVSAQSCRKADGGMLILIHHLLALMLFCLINFLPWNIEDILSS